MQPEILLINKLKAFVHLVVEYMIHWVRKKDLKMNIEVIMIRLARGKITLLNIAIDVLVAVYTKLALKP